VTDYFALLDEPRRPWLDAEALKQKFLQLSVQAHPDRVHSGTKTDREAAERRFSELNAAYNCLREPKDRLLHLLELERKAKPKDIERIPPGVMELFMEVGRVCREVDAFLREKAAVSSPLLQVQMFQKGQEWTDTLVSLQRRISQRHEQLLAELAGMNPAWAAARRGEDAHPDGLLLDRLEQIYRILSYQGRWTGQLQERLAQLSF
jgi:curved DNA-binding protein CbpA